MNDPQLETTNTEIENQVNNPTPEQITRRRRAKYSREWRARNPDKVALARKNSRDKKREAYRLRTGCQPQPTYWRDLALEPKGIYQVKTLGHAQALRKAIQKLGFHAKSEKTNRGYKVYKLKLAYE